MNGLHHLKIMLIQRQLFFQDCKQKNLEILGNDFIDKFIQESQLNAQYTNQILEWIPYNSLENIEYVDKGGFGTIYKAIWLDGPINFWSNSKKKWIRSNEIIVALKSLNKSSNLSEDLLKEV